MYHSLLSLASLLVLASARPFGLKTRDANPGCTSHSFGDFAWGLVGFDYHASYVFTTPAHQNSWGYVNFNLTNPALTYPAICSAASSQLSDFFYGNFEYTCTLPADVDSATSTTFEFNRASGLLNVTQTWTCSDVDAQYPTRFTYYGAVNLTLDCTDTTWNNPNWTQGQIYSDREVRCAPFNGPVEPWLLTAVA